MRAAIAALVLLTTVGCGGDASDPDGAASSADFLDQATAICAEATARLQTASADVDPQNRRALLRLVRDVVVPNVRGQLADIRALGLPDDEITGILDDAEAIADSVAARPATLLDNDPFADVNQRLIAYGLPACGGR